MITLLVMAVVATIIILAAIGYVAVELRRARRRFEQAQARQQQVQAQRDREPQEQAVQNAYNRAESLLFSNLSPEQRESYLKYKYFIVTVGTHHYEIGHSWVGGVYRLNRHNKMRVARYCCHPSQFVPLPDLMLAQKLHLEADEAGFLKKANIL